MTMTTVVDDDGDDGDDEKYENYDDDDDDDDDDEHSDILHASVDCALKQKYSESRTGPRIGQPKPKGLVDWLTFTSHEPAGTTHTEADLSSGLGWLLHAASGSRVLAGFGIFSYIAHVTWII